MRLPDRFLIFATPIILAISALFCIIGLATKGWYTLAFSSLGLFDTDPKAPQALSIISFILLIACIIMFIVQIIGYLPDYMRYLPIGILFIATIFLLATFTSSVSQTLGYSFNLMVAAHFFSYVAFAFTAYVLGRSDALANSNVG